MGVTHALPSISIGSWGLAVPGWKEPSKLNHLPPFQMFRDLAVVTHRGGGPPHRASSSYGSLHLPKQVTGRPPIPSSTHGLPASPWVGAVGGYRVSGAPHGKPSSGSAPDPHLRRHLHLHPWLCLHGAAPCVCCPWLFSESLHVPSSTRQVRQGKALVFTDDKTEA